MDQLVLLVLQIVLSDMLWINGVLSYLCLFDRPQKAVEWTVSSAGLEVNLPAVCLSGLWTITALVATLVAMDSRRLRETDCNMHSV